MFGFKFKRLTAILLMAVMVVTIMPAVSLKAEETTEQSTYTVTFAVNEHAKLSHWNKDKTVTVTADEVIPADEIPADPYKRNCKFLGWTTTNNWRFINPGEDLTTYDFWDFKNDTVTADTKLYPNWQLADNWWETEEDDSLRTGGTDLRIMSYNVSRSGMSDDMDQAMLRAEQLKKVLECYQPDVVCLQEFAKAYNWTEVYDSVGIDDTYTLITYESVDASYETDSNYLQFRIAYNHDKMELCKDDNENDIIGADNFNISIGQGWAMFQMKDSGQKFIVMSTHWDALATSNTLNEGTNPESAATRVQSLQTEYPNVPIITAGDYNQETKLTSITTRYADVTGLKLTYADALMSGFVGVCWGQGYGTSTDGDISWNVNKFENELDYTGIDHIFVSPSIKTLYFDTVINEYALNSSDHLPVYADLSFSHTFSNACDTTCDDTGCTYTRDIVRTHENHCGADTCQWCGGSNGSLKGVEDALAPIIKGATIRKMDEDETQSIRFECKIPDLTNEGKTVTEIGMVSTYYNYIKNGKITADALVKDASQKAENSNYIMEDSVPVSTTSELSKGGTFYANVGTVPESRYGYRFVVRVWAKYEDAQGNEEIYHSSNTTMTESKKDGTIIYPGSMEDAVKVEDGLCSRSVTGIAQEMAKWIYSTGRAQEPYELDDIDEKILTSVNERNGAVTWVAPDGKDKMTIEDLLKYLTTNSENIIGLKEAWDVGYTGPADYTSDVLLDFEGLEDND